MADGAAARAAEVLGKAGDAEYFAARSRSLPQLFRPLDRLHTRPGQPRRLAHPFNPFSSEHRADDYCEGNAWQYTWLAPHDVQGLQDCFGSRGRMIEKLDSLFTVSSVIEGCRRPRPDISRALSVSMRTATSLRTPRSTSTRDARAAVEDGRQRCARCSRRSTIAEPDGLSGNEDVGQMSRLVTCSRRWASTRPSPQAAATGSVLPLVRQGRDRRSGRHLHHRCRNNSNENKYIRRVWLDGRPHIPNPISTTQRSCAAPSYASRWAPSPGCGTAPTNRRSMPTSGPLPEELFPVGGRRGRDRACQRPADERPSALDVPQLLPQYPRHDGALLARTGGQPRHLRLHRRYPRHVGSAIRGRRCVRAAVRGRPGPAKDGLPGVTPPAVR